MHSLRTTVFSLVVLSLAAVAYAQDRVTVLEDLIGARGSAVDTMSDRGYTYLRTEKSGDSAYSYWRDSRTGRCVTARVADGKIASIVYAPDMDCEAKGDESSAAAGAEDSFDTVCGVITGGKTYRYRCQVIERKNEEGKRVTTLRYPDNELKLHWHREGKVGVGMQGVETVQTTYSTSEGETDFELDGKTYFYISDKKAARMELKDFKE